MTIRRGELISKEYVYDFSVDGGATGELTMRSADPNGNSLPEGFIITKAEAYVEEALTPTGGEVTFGNSTDPNGYIDNIRAAYNAQNSVVRSGELAGVLLWDDTNDHEINYRVDDTADNQAVIMDIGTNALTAGKIRLVLSGYIPTERAGIANS